MQILAVDTSSLTCSVAVIVEGQVVDTSYTSNRTHSGHLMEMVEHTLSLAGTRLNQLDGFAVTRGPGTFTGLRIGISAVKGFALAAGRPLVGISGLEALATQSAVPSCLIYPMIDARRKEVYCARYRLEDNRLRRISAEKACPPAKAAEEVKEPCLFVGNGAQLYRELIIDATGETGAVAPDAQNIIRASTIARLAADRLKKGGVDDTRNLVPLYIRKSDAELKLGGKRQGMIPS